MHPYLIHLGHFYLPTFGLLAAVGLMLALALSQRTARMAGVDPDQLWNAGLFTVIAAFLSSRLLLVADHLRSFLAFPLLLLAVPSLTPSGLFLTAIATWLWLRWNHLPVLRALDAWAPCAALVWCFLALGHFAEGSDPGMPLHPLTPTSSLYPVALFAAALALLLALGLNAGLQRRRPPGQIAGFGLMAAGASQFLLSFIRQPGLEAFYGLDLLQWVALGMLLAGTVLCANALVR